MTDRDSNLLSKEPRTMQYRGTLRMLTYMAPDYPLKHFELMRDYLEEMTGLNAYLTTESRSKGPLSDRPDPFTESHADIVFLSSTAYLDLKAKENKFMEMCEAAPLYMNSRANDQPVCFCDIVVLQSKVEQHGHWRHLRHVYKDFESLRGSRWAYATKDSLSSSTAMLQEIKKHGYNTNFFSNTFQAGSHINALRMLLSGQVDVATVSSVVLAAYKADNPHMSGAFSVLKSLGPLPVYTIAFNRRMKPELKAKITKSFLELSMNDKFASQFITMGIKGFKPVAESSLYKEVDMVKSVKEMSLAPAYY